MTKGAKQVSFKVPASKLASGADAWIANRGAEPASDREGGNVTALKTVEATPAEVPVAHKEKMVRFTFDIPEKLHRRIKSHCGANGLKMADVVRAFLEREFPAT